ncbi:glycosyltransferase family 61 protein, partial [Ponticoccus gilvus]|nr:glycosyltransferase family 61 protein [Enemella evansiae]
MSGAEPRRAFDAALSRNRTAQALEALVTCLAPAGPGGGAGPGADWRDAAYDRLATALGATDRADPVGFDRPATLHVVSPQPMPVQAQPALLMALRARPAERHVILFTGPEPDAAVLDGLIAQGAFVLPGDPAVDRLDRWHWLRGRLGALRANRVMIHADPGDVLAGLAARLLAPDYGPRLYLLHHGPGPEGLIPDLIGDALGRATHLVAGAGQKPALRAAWAGAGCAGRPRMAVLPAGFDRALQPPLDMAEMAQMVPVAPIVRSRNPAVLLRSGLRHLRDRARRRGAEMNRQIAALTSGGDPVSATCADLTRIDTAALADFTARLVELLEAGVRRHMHFGPVTSRVERAVQDALEAAGLDTDRVVLTGIEPSLANALKWHKVTVFLDGMPGLTTIGLAEVAASEVPIAVHAEAGARAAGRPPALTWSGAAELAGLTGAPRAELLRAAGRWYRTRAVQPVFERRLSRVIGVTEGPMRDDLPSERIRALTARLLDAEWYLEQNPDVARAGVDPLEHYLKDGEREGRAPCALFHPRHYAANLDPRDRPARGLAAHYLAYGEARGHAPHPLFAPLHCAAFLPGEAAAEDSDPPGILERYLTAFGTDVAPHPLFDPVHYAKALDLPPEDLPLLLHFLETGAAEGLSPHPLIEGARLLEWDADPAAAFVFWASRAAAGADEPRPSLLFDPVHFCGPDHARYANAAPTLLWAHLIEANRRTRGPHPLIDPAHVARRRPEVLTHNRRPVLLDMAQGRLEGIDTHPLVSCAHILKQAPWVAQGNQHPTRYFIERATAENLDSHPYFSTQVYLLNGPDVAAAGVNPLLHYLAHGQYEGRLPHLFFDGNDYYTRYLRDAGGTSPLLDYVQRGAGLYRPVLPHDGAQHGMGVRTARAAFSAGAAPADAEAILKTAIHPGWGAPHPDLEVRTVALARKSDRPAARRTLHKAQEVTLSRPAVMAGTHIAPPPVAYTAPAVSVGRWDGATVIGGNDGFLGAGDRWHPEGPEEGPLPDSAEAADADRALRPQTSLVARRDDAALLRHYGTEQGLARAILACGSRSGVFDHFLLEVLPRALAAAERAPAGTPLLIEDDLPALHRQALRLALPDHPLIQVARGRQVKVAQLYAASMGNRLGSPRAGEAGSASPAALVLHPALVARLGDLAGAIGLAGPGLRPGAAPRVLLQSDTPATRAVVNLPEVVATLAGAGFATRSFDRLTFTDLVRVVAEAEEIVITDGPQVAALAFARPGTRIHVLLSNAPGTDFHRADLLGRLRGAQVVSFAGWQLQGSAGPHMAPAEAHFSLPVDHLRPFFTDGRR